MSNLFEIRAAGDIDRLIALAASMNLVGRVELLRAVRAGVISLVEPERDGEFPLRGMAKLTSPVLALIGDDDYAATGPTGWAATRRLLYWAKGGLVHATGADVPSYQAAIRTALAYRRFVLIETDTVHAAEWANVLVAHRIPCIALMPSDGAAHPVPLERDAVQ